MTALATRLTKADLAKYPEAERMAERNRTMRQQARQRLGMSDVDLAKVLGVDVAAVVALESGVLDVAAGPFDTNLVEIPEPAMNAWQRDVCIAYRRFLRACEVLPAQALVQELHPALANVAVGELDVLRAAEIVEGARGFLQTGARRATAVRRVQALQSCGVSVATFAHAVGVDAELCLDWLVHGEVPLTDKGETFWRLLSYLHAGPSWSVRDNKPSAQHYF